MRPPERPFTCRSVLGLLLNDLGLTGVGVEVGVQQGVFAKHLLRTWYGRLLYLVDCWREQPREVYNDPGNAPDWAQDQFLAETVRNVFPFVGRYALLPMMSTEAARRCPDASLDFVYLDANHDWDAVAADLRAWAPKVKPGGVLAGHDYMMRDEPHQAIGVKGAVDEFVAARGLELHVTQEEVPSWLVRL